MSQKILRTMQDDLKEIKNIKTDNKGIFKKSEPEKKEEAKKPLPVQANIPVAAPKTKTPAQNIPAKPEKGSFADIKDSLEQKGFNVSLSPIPQGKRKEDAGKDFFAKLQEKIAKKKEELREEPQVQSEKKIEPAKKIEKPAEKPIEKPKVEDIKKSPEDIAKETAKREILEEVKKEDAKMREDILAQIRQQEELRKQEVQKAQEALKIQDVLRQQETKKAEEALKIQETKINNILKEVTDSLNQEEIKAAESKKALIEEEKKNKEAILEQIRKQEDARRQEIQKAQEELKKQEALRVQEAKMAQQALREEDAKRAEEALRLRKAIESQEAEIADLIKKTSNPLKKEDIIEEMRTKILEEEKRNKEDILAQMKAQEIQLSNFIKEISGSLRKVAPQKEEIEREIIAKIRAEEEKTRENIMAQVRERDTKREEEIGKLQETIQEKDTQISNLVRGISESLQEETEKGEAKEKLIEEMKAKIVILEEEKKKEEDVLSQIKNKQKEEEEAEIKKEAEQRIAEEEARKKQEEEKEQEDRAEEERLRQEEIAQRAAEEEEKQRQEELQKTIEEAEQKAQKEENERRIKEEEEAKATEEERLKQEEEQRAVEEERLRKEEAQKVAEEEEKQRQEAQKAIEEAAQKAQEEERLRQEEAQKIIEEIKSEQPKIKPEEKQESDNKEEKTESSETFWNALRKNRGESPTETKKEPLTPGDSTNNTNQGTAEIKSAETSVTSVQDEEIKDLIKRVSNSMDTSVKSPTLSQETAKPDKDKELKDLLSRMSKTIQKEQEDPAELDTEDFLKKNSRPEPTSTYNVSTEAEMEKEDLTSTNQDKSYWEKIHNTIKEPAMSMQQRTMGGTSIGVSPYDRPSENITPDEDTGLVMPNEVKTAQQRIQERRLSQSYVNPENRLIYGKQQFYSTMHKSIKPKTKLESLEGLDNVLKEEEIELSDEEERKRLKHNIITKYGIKLFSFPWVRVILITILFLTIIGGALIIVLPKFKPTTQELAPVVVGKSISDIDKKITAEAFAKQNQVTTLNYFDANLDPWKSFNNGAIVRLNVNYNNQDIMVSREEALKAILGESNASNIPDDFMDATSAEYNILVFKEGGSLRIGLVFKYNPSKEEEFKDIMSTWEKTNTKSKKIYTIMKNLFVNSRIIEQDTLSFQPAMYNGTELKFINLPDSDTSMDYFMYEGFIVFTSSKDHTFQMIDLLKS